MNCRTPASATHRTFILLSLLVLAFANQASAQDVRTRPQDTIRAGSIEFQFATAQQGKQLLRQEDAFVRNLSPFDRQVRMHSERDLGQEAYLKFVAGEVIDWPKQDRQAVRKAIELLDKPLRQLKLPQTETVFLIHTTGREESNAAYTRGSAIVLPKGKTGTTQKPANRRVAHEVFHVLSRTSPKWRDQLYAIIGFEAINQVELPDDLRHRRITNPDAPEVAHAIELKIDENRRVMVAPVLFAKSKFDPGQRSLFSYLSFKLMELTRVGEQPWSAKLVDGKPVLHEPSLRDFHRQIGANTGYIIHPDEILADNFTAIVLGTSVKDQWVTDGMKAVMTREPDVQE